MVRTYKKKSSRLSWSMENMKQAIDAVLSKTVGYRKTGHLYGVPQTTLERHVAKIRKGELSLDSTPGNFKPVFSKQEEEELVRYIIEMEKRLFGLTTIVLRKLAYQLINSNPNDPKLKKNSKKQKTQEAPSGVENSHEDTICLYCLDVNHTYLKSSEGWVACQLCGRWANIACAGVDDENTKEIHICLYCDAK